MVLLLRAVAREALAAVAGEVAWLEDRGEMKVDTDPKTAAELEQFLRQFANQGPMPRQQAQKIARCLAQEELADNQEELRQARTSLQCLVAIGDHIEASKWPAWLGGLVTKPLLWQFVAAATRNQASGEQMACQYQGIERKRDQQAAGL
jgi:hypothetical protein